MPHIQTQPQPSAPSGTPPPMTMPLPVLNRATLPRVVPEESSRYSIGTSAAAAEYAERETK